MDIKIEVAVEQNEQVENNIINPKNGNYRPECIILEDVYKLWKKEFEKKKIAKSDSLTTAKIKAKWKCEWV